MKKVQFLRKQDDLVLDSLMYKMKMKWYEPNTVVFDKGLKTPGVYFLIEGGVNLYVEIQDFTVVQNYEFKHFRAKSVKVLQKGNTLTQSKKKSESLSLTLINNKRIQMKLCQLDAGSILCTKQVLFESFLCTKAVSNDYSRALLLNLDSIEKIAQKSKSLARAVKIVRDQYTHHNRYFKDYQVIPPVFDCYKYFENKSSFKHWRMSSKFKNAVLMVIMRNRPKVKMGIGINKSFVQRLKAITEAENNNWTYLANLIERKEISYTIIKIARFLKEENIKKPIMKQIANIATEGTEGYDRVRTSYSKAIHRSVRVRKKMRKLRRKIRQIHKLVRIMNEYLD